MSGKVGFERNGDFPPITADFTKPWSYTACVESNGTDAVVWIGVVGIVPRDGCELLEPEKGAYVNFLTLASSDSEYRAKVIGALSYYRLELLEFEDVRPLSASDNASEEILQIAEELEQSRNPQQCALRHFQYVPSPHVKMSAMAIFRQLTSDTPANPMATLEMMTQTNHPEQLSPLAQRAWKRIESEFPSWTAHLNTREGELEFAVPAPTGSAAGHLVAFSNHDELWIRFSPPNMCYPADDENELTSLIKRLTADEIVFKVVRKDGEWVETTLTVPDGRGETIPGHTVQFISWTGMADANY